MSTISSGLTSSLKSLVDSLNVNQATMSVISDNIANVNTVGYTRKIVAQETKVAGGTVSGVSITEIRRAIDDFLINASRNQTSKVSEAATKNAYHDRIQQFTLGDPGSSFTIGSSLNNFFGKLSDFANDASSPVKANLVVTAARDFAESISTISTGIQNERFNADKDLQSTVGELNSILGNLKDINGAIKENYLVQGNLQALYDARDNELMKLQNIIDADINFDSIGQVTASLGNTEILSPSQSYEVVYTRASNIENLINGAPFNPITVVALDDNGERTNKVETYFSGNGGQAEIDDLKNGKLKALLELRDTELPEIISQLDMLAYTFADQFNEIHNGGTAYPPPQQLTGVESFKLSDTFNFQGTTRITLVDELGKPLTGRYGEELVPLEINFDEFNGGEGKGTASVQAIIDEINNYYGTQAAQIANVGPAQDIKIAGVSENITSVKSTGTITFSGQPTAGQNIVINGVTVTFVSGVPSGNQVQIGANLTSTLNNLTGFLNTSANASLNVATYSNNNTAMTVKYDAAGTTGNAFTLTAGTASAVATASGATLAGGADASGNFEFDFDFTNLSDDGGAITFDVTSISINGGASSAVTFGAFTQEAGKRSRTDMNGIINDSINVDLTGLGLEEGDTFTISAVIAVTDADGNVTNETVTFQLTVPDPETGSTLNKRYAATAVSGSGGGEIVTANSNSSFLAASLVDANGNQISSGSSGFLKLNGANSNIRISIDQLDSKEVGTFGVADAEATATNRGFSHFFGMNNFFTFGDELKNSSVNLDIRSDILRTPTNLATGRAQQSPQTGVTAKYSYEIGAASNQAVKDLITLRDININFKAAGSLPTLSTTIGGYATELYNFAASLANSASSDFDKETLLGNSLKQKVDDVSGVNMDEEIANTIKIQNSYNASAKVLSMIREMFKTLEESV